jgi:hypothetical protein
MLEKDITPIIFFYFSFFLVEKRESIKVTIPILGLAGVRDKEGSV